MAIDDQSARRTAAVLRNALGTLDRNRGRPSVLWEHFSVDQRNMEEARLQEAIDAGVYVPQESDAEALALEQAIVGTLLGDEGIGSELAFAVQPSAADEGAAINPAVQVALRDGLGRVIESFTGDIVIALASGEGELTGTLTQAAVDGVATFDDLEIDTAGDYTLVATHEGLSVTSEEFTISEP